MKNKFIIILGICFFCQGFIQGQENNLYLIAGQGCPGNCVGEYAEHYPVHLLKLNNDTLQKVNDLATGKEFVFKIAKYEGFKKVIVYKSSLFDNETRVITIDYNSELQIDTFIHKFPLEAFLDFMFYAVDIDDPYIIIEYYPDFNGNQDSSFFYGINLKTHKDTLFDNTILRNLHTEGEQAIAQVRGTSEDAETIKFKTSLIKNKLVYKMFYPSLPLDTCEIMIPKFKNLAKIYNYILKPSKGYRKFNIFNKHYKLIKTNFNWDKKRLSSSHKYAIFDDNLKAWSMSSEFKGSYEEGIKISGNYLVGYVALEYQYGFEQKMKKYGSIPGLKYRQKASIYGSTFDERAKEYKLYPEGILYAYNLKTFKYLEWNALENGEHQGDSEILLIQDEIIYYRINDKIYKVPIINDEELGEHKLIVKDNRIPDVHWAFIIEN